MELGSVVEEPTQSQYISQDEARQTSFGATEDWSAPETKIRRKHGKKDRKRRKEKKKREMRRARRREKAEEKSKSRAFTEESAEQQYQSKPAPTKAEKPPTPPSFDGDFEGLCGAVSEDLTRACSALALHERDLVSIGSGILRAIPHQYPLRSYATQLCCCTRCCGRCCDVAGHKHTPDYGPHGGRNAETEVVESDLMYIGIPQVRKKVSKRKRHSVDVDISDVSTASGVSTDSLLIMLDAKAGEEPGDKSTSGTPQTVSHPDDAKLTDKATAALKEVKKWIWMSRQFEKKVDKLKHATTDTNEEKARRDAKIEECTKKAATCEKNARKAIVKYRHLTRSAEKSALDEKSSSDQPKEDAVEDDIARLDEEISSKVVTKTSNEYNGEHKKKTDHAAKSGGTMPSFNVPDERKARAVASTKLDLSTEWKGATPDSGGNSQRHDVFYGVQAGAPKQDVNAIRPGVPVRPEMYLGGPVAPVGPEGYYGRPVAPVGPEGYYGRPAVQVRPEEHIAWPGTSMRAEECIARPGAPMRPEEYFVRPGVPIRPEEYFSRVRNYRPDAPLFRPFRPGIPEPVEQDLYRRQFGPGTSEPYLGPEKRLSPEGARSYPVVTSHYPSKYGDRYREYQGPTYNNDDYYDRRRESEDSILERGRSRSPLITAAADLTEKTETVMKHARDAVEAASSLRKATDDAFHEARLAEEYVGGRTHSKRDEMSEPYTYFDTSKGPSRSLKFRSTGQERELSDSFDESSREWSSTRKDRKSSSRKARKQARQPSTTNVPKTLTEKTRREQGKEHSGQSDESLLRNERRRPKFAANVPPGTDKKAKPKRRGSVYVRGHLLPVEDDDEDSKSHTEKQPQKPATVAPASQAKDEVSPKKALEAFLKKAKAPPSSLSGRATEKAPPATATTVRTVITTEDEKKVKKSQRPDKLAASLTSSPTATPKTHKQVKEVPLVPIVFSATRVVRKPPPPPPPVAPRKIFLEDKTTSANIPRPAPTTGFCARLRCSQCKNKLSPCRSPYTWFRSLCSLCTSCSKKEPLSSDTSTTEAKMSAGTASESVSSSSAWKPKDNAPTTVLAMASAIKKPKHSDSELSKSAPDKKESSDSSAGPAVEIGGKAEVTGPSSRATDSYRRASDQKESSGEDIATKGRRETESSGSGREPVLPRGVVSQATMTDEATKPTTGTEGTSTVGGAATNDAGPEGITAQLPVTQEPLSEGALPQDSKPGGIAGDAASLISLSETGNIKKEVSDESETAGKAKKSKRKKRKSSKKRSSSLKQHILKSGMESEEASRASASVQGETTKPHDINLIEASTEKSRDGDGLEADNVSLILSGADDLKELYHSITDILAGSEHEGQPENKPSTSSNVETAERSPLQKEPRVSTVSGSERKSSQGEQGKEKTQETDNEANLEPQSGGLGSASESKPDEGSSRTDVPDAFYVPDTSFHRHHNGKVLQRSEKERKASSDAELGLKAPSSELDKNKGRNVDSPSETVHDSTIRFNPEVEIQPVLLESEAGDISMPPKTERLQDTEIEDRTNALDGSAPAEKVAVKTEERVRDHEPFFRLDTVEPRPEMVHGFGVEYQNPGGEMNGSQVPGERQDIAKETQEPEPLQNNIANNIALENVRQEPKESQEDNKVEEDIEKKHEGGKPGHEPQKEEGQDEAYEEGQRVAQEAREVYEEPATVREENREIPEEPEKTPEEPHIVQEEPERADEAPEKMPEEYDKAGDEPEKMDVELEKSDKGAGGEDKAGEEAERISEKTEAAEGIQNSDEIATVSQDQAPNELQVELVDEGAAFPVALEHPASEVQFEVEPPRLVEGDARRASAEAPEHRPLEAIVHGEEKLLPRLVSPKSLDTVTPARTSYPRPKPTPLYQEDPKFWAVVDSASTYYPESKVLFAVGCLSAFWILFVLVSSSLPHNIKAFTRRTASTQSKPAATTTAMTTGSEVTVTVSSEVTIPLSVYFCDIPFCRMEADYLSGLPFGEACSNFYSYVCNGRTSQWFPKVGAAVSTDSLITERLESFAIDYIRDASDTDMEVAREMFILCVDARQTIQNFEVIEDIRQLFAEYFLDQWPIVDGASSNPLPDMWTVTGHFIRDLDLEPLVSISIDAHPEERGNNIIGIDEPDLPFRRKDFTNSPVLQLITYGLKECIDILKSVADLGKVTDDVIGVMTNLSKLVTEPSIRYLGTENYRVLPLAQMSGSVRNVLEVVFDGLAPIENNTQVLVKSPSFYVLMNLTQFVPSAILNYLGFRMMVHFAAFLPASSLQELNAIALERSQRGATDTVTTCSKEVERFIPAAYLRAIALRSGQIGFTTMGKMWSSKVEVKFTEGLRRLAWIRDRNSQMPSVSDLHLARQKLQSNRLTHFFPLWVANNKTFSDYMQRLGKQIHPLNKGRAIPFHRGLSTALRLDKLLQLDRNYGNHTTTMSLFDTIPHYDVQRKTLHIPIAVMNDSIPWNGSMFVLHIARYGVRIFKGLLPMLYNDFVFSGSGPRDGTPLLFGEDYEKRLRETVGCLLQDFNNIPETIKSDYTRNMVSVDSAGFAFLEQTVAVMQAFWAFQELLSIKRIWNSDFRLSNLPELSANQLFFMYYALDNCEASDDVYRGRKFETRFTLPPEDRVNFPLTQFDEFRKAFGCNRRTAMVSTSQCSVIDDRG